MTLYQGKLCSAILQEHFGDIVQKVGDHLFNNGTQGLIFIRMITGLPLSKVKEALCVLIKHGFVFHEQTLKGMRYTLKPDLIVMMIRYPRFMFHVKICCGDEAEIMLEEILKQGYDSASQVIVKAFQKLKEKTNAEPSIPFLKEKFEALTKDQFVMRCVCSAELGESSTDKADYDLPDLNVPALVKLVQGETSDAGDKKIYWRVNFDRLMQDLRDQVIVQATTSMIDDNAGELMRQMIYLMYARTASWAETSNPIPYHDIREKIKQMNRPALTQYLDQYLRLIEEDPRNFLKRVGDSGGGQFSVNVKDAFASLALATVENIITERFGSKAGRVFRLIWAKKYIEIESIQNLAMIGAKESKHLTYTLHQDNYIQLQDVRKTGVPVVAGKPFFLFHIDLNQVVRMLVEHCYHAIYNTIQRRDHELASNKRLIDQYLRLQTMVSNLRDHGAPEQQIADAEETMSLPAKLQLQKVENEVKTLRGAELQIEETLLIFSMYLRYH